MQNFFQPLLGGVLIGIASSVMLIANGRVTGISGILNMALKGRSADGPWRYFFLVAFLLAGLVMKPLAADLFVDTSGRPWWLILIAGLLVGFGTVMGSGCTSGHGVCGISRLSIRSIVATLVFIFFGGVSVFLYKTLIGAL